MVRHETPTLEERASTYVRAQLEGMDEWERALHREWCSLASRNLLTQRLEDGARKSESTQTTPASEAWNPRSLPAGTVIQRDRQRGRSRFVLSGEYIPYEKDPSIVAINVGTLKASTSDEDKYCMLDSGANVMVVPRVKGMEGDKTMCSLVGDKKTEGLIISRLFTETRSDLVVMVENASALLPPAYLVRIAGYKLVWGNVPGGEYFQLRGGYGESVSVQEDDDLLLLGKNTLWRVGHDMYRLMTSIQDCPASGPLLGRHWVDKNKGGQTLPCDFGNHNPLQPPRLGNKESRSKQNGGAIIVQQIPIVEASTCGLSPACVELTSLERIKKRFFKVKGGTPPIRTLCAPVLCVEAKLLISMRSNPVGCSPKPIQLDYSQKRKGKNGLETCESRTTPKREEKWLFSRELDRHDS